MNYIKIKDTNIILEDGDRGKNYPNPSELFSKEYCLFLNNKNIVDNKLNLLDANYITENKCKKLNAGLLSRNNIILTTRGTLGNCLFVDENFPLPCRINSGMIIIKPDVSYIPKFIYYYLCSEFFKSQIEEMKSGAAQPQLPIKDILNMKLPVEKLSKQQHIVDTIGTVDDLIEKNQEIDKKLIDLLCMKYDQMIDNEELNNTSFEDFAFYQEGPGIRNWQYVKENGVKFINIRCINENNLNLDDANMISKEEAYGVYKHFLVDNMDILVSTSGTLGRLAIARKNHLPLCMNTSVIRFKPLNKDNYSFLFCYLMSDEFKNTISSMANGSAQLNFGPTHIKQLKLKIPNQNILTTFNDIALPLIKQHISLLDKIDKLKNVKSSLLLKYFG